VIRAGEEWRPIVGNEWYSVSSFGRVLSTAPAGNGRDRTPRLVTPRPNTNGYLRIPLAEPDRPGRPRSRYIHHLVAEAFLGPRPAGLKVRYIDGDALNNALSNLKYGTHSENELDKVRHGTHQAARRTHCRFGHPLDGVRKTRTGSQRFCRTCRRASNLATYYRRVARMREAS
jgi:hypothetical protein